MNIFIEYAIPLQKTKLVTQSLVFTPKKQNRELLLLSECKVCKIQFQESNQYDLHLETQEHKLRYLYANHK